MAPKKRKRMTPNIEKNLDPKGEMSMAPQEIKCISPKEEQSMAPQEIECISPKEEQSMAPKGEKCMTEQKKECMVSMEEESMVPKEENSMVLQEKDCMVPKKTPTIESLTDLSLKNEIGNEISNSTQLKNINVNNEENLPNSSSSMDFLSNLKSVIDKVKNLHIPQSVHIYSITPEGKGISAVDVNHSLSHLAYSFCHSCDIRLRARNSLSSNIAGKDFNSTWSNFVCAKSLLTADEISEEEKIECLSSPHEYIFKHNNDVTGLRFSLDDSLLLSCSLDGSAKVISTTTYRVLENYVGCGLFTDIDLNSATTQFAVTNTFSWNPFYAAYLYNFERKKPVQCFSGHTDTLKCVRFHQNGLYIATASSDRSIKLWSIQQEKEVRSFQDEGIDHPEKITFSPDGKYIASTYSGCVKIWDLAAGKLLKCLETSTSDPCILNVCYNSKGNMLAAGGSDGQLHFWNVISDESSEVAPDYVFLKSECLDNHICSIKYVSSFFSCVTG